jgi:hypothetical protein
MSSEGPYGRHGFQSNPNGYAGGAAGGASYGGGYAAPQYGYGGASYAAPAPASYGSDYGGYSGGAGVQQAAGEYQVGAGRASFVIVVSG